MTDYGWAANGIWSDTLIDVKLMTTAEVATRLGVTRGRVSHYVTEGRLIPAHTSSQGNLFAVRDVERFAKKPRPNGHPATARAS